VADVRVFLSFDRDHDSDLYERIVVDSKHAGSGFEIVEHSETRGGEPELRRRMATTEHLIVLCGEHTDESERMSSELNIARETKLPFLLLWGRRESMCTRPMGATRDNSMYVWSREVVREQLAVALRSSTTRDALARVPRPHRN
jgi:hypothetical protein